MPAKSKAQQRLFGMALAQKRGKMKGASDKVKEIANDMPETEIKKFAKTKRSKLKENFVMKFDEFINEAYVDQEGNLQDFEITPEEEYAMHEEDLLFTFEQILTKRGAEEVSSSIQDEKAKFKFYYNSERYAIRINIDDDYAMVVRYDRDSRMPDLVYNGNTEHLINIIKKKGLTFLEGI
jgi:hypothetical protein